MPSREEFEAALRSTLDDQRLSRGEKRALKEVLAPVPEAERVAHRALAFDLARRTLGNDKRIRQIVGWLEDVVKLLDAPREDHTVGAYFSPGEAPLAKICALFAEAHERVDVCVFTITDDRITQALMEAHRRGVRVRVVADDDKANDRGSDIDRIAAAGIPVRLDHSEHHMHHKFALFDERQLLTGSYNWTRSAGRYNHENLVVTADPRLVRAFADAFERIWDDFG